MGQRISYYKNNFQKTLKEILFENFPAFREWYLNFEKSSLEEFNEPFGNEMLIDYFKLNPDFKTDFPKLDKKIIDELTSEFIGVYCDFTDRGGKILQFFGPTFNKWRYDQSTEMIEQSGDALFIRLWNFIIKGRSLTDNDVFESFTNDRKVGFLTFDEHRVLKDKIESYFGSIEIMKDKYWTEKEKSEEREAIANSKDGAYSLSQHNPKSFGLEIVLQVLNEISTYKNELITFID